MAPKKASSRRPQPRKRKPVEDRFLIPAGVYSETRPAPVEPTKRWRGFAALLCLVPIFGGIRLLLPSDRPPTATYAYPAPSPTAAPLTVATQPAATGQEFALSPARVAPPVVSAPAPEPETNYVTGKRVPMRDAARAGSPILDRLASGQAVSVLVRQGEWVKVRHGLTQREGWMQAQRLTNSPPTASVKEEHKPSAGPKLSAAAITKLLIAASLSSYPGSCACPYNTDRGGRSCGRRSAYTRPGGYSPLCFAKDITPEMIAEYRASN